jgi:signal transduction histidine kinase
MGRLGRSGRASGSVIAGYGRRREQPVRKGNPSAEGNGLGLAIVRQAVELHRGSMQVGRSSLDGAMFKLHFA